jgi:hypothetical protein
MTTVIRSSSDIVENPERFLADVRAGHVDHTITGDYLPPQINEQAKQFIDRSRAVPLDQWECHIGTAQLIERSNLV